MRQALAGFVLAVVLATGLVAAQSSSKAPGVMLADLSWYDASAALTTSTVVVIPLGIATVEHGPHLKLNNNERLANYLASRVKAAASVVIAPTFTYYFSPTFLEYPGSTSISRTTAQDTTLDVVRSLAHYGPRRFYVINTGITSAAPLQDAAERLKDEGILFDYTDARLHLLGGAGLPSPPHQEPTGRGVGQADEIETSIMLYVDPSAVDMSKAVREYGTGEGPMTRQKDAPGLYSATGVFGDPTLATREKGKAIVENLVDRVLEDIEKIRKADLPTPRTPTPPPPAPARTPPPPPRPDRQEQRINGCTAQEFRAIQLVGARYSSLWRQMDAQSLSLLFTPDGDIRHPDGSIERGQETIRQNRAELFGKAEYRGSSHPLTLSDIRCVTPKVAIADGKWELRLADTTSGSAPTGPLRGLSPDKYNNGLCTLIMVGSGSNWQIEAWRYTVNPPNGAPPITLTKPGFIGRGGGQ
jgi:creatinine amidohydrolase